MKEKLFSIIESKLLPWTFVLIGTIFGSFAKAEKVQFISQINNQADLNRVLDQDINIAPDLDSFKRHLSGKYGFESLNNEDIYLYLNDGEISEFKEKLEQRDLNLASPGPNCAC